MVATTGNNTARWIQAATVAGFTAVRLVNRATAVAAAYQKRGFDGGDPDEHLLGVLIADGRSLELAVFHDSPATEGLFFRRQLLAAGVPEAMADGLVGGPLRRPLQLISSAGRANFGEWDFREALVGACLQRIGVFSHPEITRANAWAACPEFGALPKHLKYLVNQFARYMPVYSRNGSKIVVSFNWPNCLGS
jgi:hypothetical protein